MVSNKGFMNIIETIIASILILSIVPILLQTQQIEEDWTESELRNIGNDVLTNLERKGKLNNLSYMEENEIETIIDDMLGEDSVKIQYEIEIRDSYRNDVGIGIVCKDCESDINKKDLINPFQINNRWIDIELYMYDQDNITFDMDDIKDESDVLLLYGDEGAEIAENETGQIEDYVEGGRGLVQYSNMTKDLYSQTEEVQDELFGITDVNDSDTNDNIYFNNTEDPTRDNYEPYKLFEGVSIPIRFEEGTSSTNMTLRQNDYTVQVNDNNFDESTDIDIEDVDDQLNLGDNFTLDGTEFKVSDINQFESGTFSDDGIIRLKPKENYHFHNFIYFNVSIANKNNKVLNVNEKPVSVIHDKINGRTAWISKGDGNDINTVLQSLVYWSADRGETIYHSETKDDEVVQVSRLASRSEEIFEPGEIVMDLWFTF